MPEIDDLLQAERNRRRPGGRRARVALIVAGAATVVAVGTGATLAATAATSLIRHEAESSTVDDVDAPTLEQTTLAAEPRLSTNEPAANESTADEPATGDPAAAGQPAPNEFGFPVYDASTDIATIPRPDDDPDPANTEVWLTQQGIIADCMQEKGLEYRYTGYWLVPPGVTWEERQAALDEAQAGTPEFEALHGVAEFGPDDPAVAPPYRWEDAGCVGYAVHVTGMDDAH